MQLVFRIIIQKILISADKCKMQQGMPCFVELMVKRGTGGFDWLMKDSH